MNIDVARHNSVVILKPRGRMITEERVRSFKKAINREISESDPPKLIIDFSEVGMMASIGLGAIMEAGMAIKKKRGRIAVIHLSSPVNSLLVMSQLISHFEHFKNEHEAVVALSS